MRRLLTEAAARLWRRLTPHARWWLLHQGNDRFLVGVLGLIEDLDGRVLLLEHRYRVPWRWGLPGGFLMHGEHLTEGLRRELREETGLELEIDPEPFDLELAPRTRHLTVTFRARAAGGLDVAALDPEELLGGGFFAPGELPQTLYPRHRALLERPRPPFPGGRAIASRDAPGHNSRP